MKRFLSFTFVLVAFIFSIHIKVSAFQIADNQTVDTNKIWTIRFTNEVGYDDLTKQGTTVVDSKGNMVNVTLSLGQDSKSIVVTAPQGGYKSGENYTLSIGKNVHSKNGKTLKQIRKINFNIAPATLPTNIPDTSQDVRGNTTWNISNGGHTAQSGEWIYYSNFSDGGKLYKIKVDGTSKTKLTDEKLFYINVIGDWIYYQSSSLSPEYDFGFYKIKTDGSQKCKILNERIGLMDIVGEWVYYSIAGESGNHWIYKMRLDGTENTQILDGKFIYNIYVIGDWIFYSTLDGTYKIKLDGTENTKVLNNSILGVMDDWIYYSDYTNGGFYKIKMDGSNNIKITDGYICSANIAGDYIYYGCGDTSDYYKSEDKWKLYKIKIDGTDKTKLTDDNGDAINVVGNWIYYLNEKDRNWYRIKIDGTGRELVN